MPELASGVVDRERILDTALEAARSAGWERVTIEEIGSRADSAPEEIRALFPTRAHAARAIMERLVDRLPGEIEDEITETSTLRDRLYTCVAHLLRSMERDKQFMRALATDVFRDGEAGALQVSTIVRYIDEIARQVEVARKKGEISRFVIPHLAASAFWLVHLRIIRYWLSDSSDNSEKTHALADQWIIGYVRTLGGAAPAPQESAAPVSES